MFKIDRITNIKKQNSLDELFLQLTSKITEKGPLVFQVNGQIKGKCYLYYNTQKGRYSSLIINETEVKSLIDKSTFTDKETIKEDFKKSIVQIYPEAFRTEGRLFEDICNGTYNEFPDFSETENDSDFIKKFLQIERLNLIEEEIRRITIQLSLKYKEDLYLKNNKGEYLFLNLVKDHSQSNISTLRLFQQNERKLEIERLIGECSTIFGIYARRIIGQDKLPDSLGESKIGSLAMLFISKKTNIYLLIDYLNRKDINPDLYKVFEEHKTTLEILTKFVQTVQRKDIVIVQELFSSLSVIEKDEVVKTVVKNLNLSHGFLVERYSGMGAGAITSGLFAFLPKSVSAIPKAIGNTVLKFALGKTLEKYGKGLLLKTHYLGMNLLLERRIIKNQTLLGLAYKGYNLYLEYFENGNKKKLKEIYEESQQGDITIERKQELHRLQQQILEELNVSEIKRVSFHQHLFSEENNK